ncbi:DUF167 domain-containing protein [Desulfuromonas thiophila]|jgi:uncharacterized protein (TIGR00251 family)|uniref:UPF0235 protein SAMN05661003_10622 n=1 Tax=Desulfuromonas thiophila TaxID=57664 RepID=A0A1G7BFJ7_9BACT|nr:DUF167 domain-containing protein [Desulfuromonas thiophila]MCK9172358.1 DUF167 domain-containing protein [Desulfuromonas thiophila]SDE25829.1 hypothetical protein SAMN05661003_10622 [Desulfuromonas thiophila]
MPAPDLSCCLRVVAGGVQLAVLVQPRASKNALCGLQGDELKLRLTSPPVDGAANKLCCDYLAKLLGCAKSAVSLVSGHSSRHKRLQIDGCSLAEVQQRLQQALDV